MFKVGDKVICINEPEINKYLKYGEIYTVKSYEVTTIIGYILELEEIENCSFPGYRFTTYNFRKEKILKLKERINESR
jgi:hypothetical protein